MTLDTSFNFQESGFHLYDGGGGGGSIGSLLSLCPRVVDGRLTYLVMICQLQSALAWKAFNIILGALDYSSRIFSAWTGNGTTQGKLGLEWVERVAYFSVLSLCEGISEGLQSRHAVLFPYLTLRQ